MSGDRARGRPRDLQIDDTVHRATLDLLAEGGFERLTMEAVAERAGVAKATLYRRFANRDALLCDALGRMNDDIPIPGPMEQSAIEAIEGVLAEIRTRTMNSPSTRVIMRLILDGRRYPHLMRLVLEGVLWPRQQRLRALLGHAKEHGLVHADLDIDAAIAMLIGPMVWLGMLQIDEEATASVDVFALQCAALGLPVDRSGRSGVHPLAPAIGDGQPAVATERAW